MDNINIADPVPVAQPPKKPAARKSSVSVKEPPDLNKPAAKSKRSKKTHDVAKPEAAPPAQKSNIIDFIANARDPAQEALSDAWSTFRQALADSTRDNLSPLFTDEFRQAVVYLKRHEATHAQARAEYKRCKHLSVSEFDKIQPPPPAAKAHTDDLDRPCYGVYDDATDYGKAGVYYHGIKTAKDGAVTEFDDYICAPLHIDAGSSDRSQKDNYGILLRFKNKRGLWAQWLMPMHMLAGDCLVLREELMKRGLFINHHKRGQLPAYLQSATPDKQLECALKVGWHDDCFVLPEQVIGNRDDIFFQADGNINADYSQKSTLADWQQHVSCYAKENPLLLFQLSTAFAGPLLDKCHLGYIGFHIFGDSSTGKSTGQEMAVSVWGNRDYQQTWKATANGLEARAAVHNDNLLALDELGESDPKEAAKTIYMIANGKGKQRANVNGKARVTQSWRLALLSNGEKTLSAHLASANVRAEAGQHARFAEIPVFGKHGAFDHLHGFDNARLFSDTLKENVQRHYGTAGIAYLEQLVQTNNLVFGELLQSVLQSFTAPNMGSQEQRVARSFALVALAGELATQFGITGWQKDHATQAALQCFQQWRNQRGNNGNNEDHAILEAIRSYIETYGDTRFTDIGKNEIHTQRSGYHIIENGEKVWLFNGSGLKEAAQGYDIKRVCRALSDAGWLQSGQKGFQRQKKIDLMPARFYFISPKIAQNDDIGSPD